MVGKTLTKPQATNFLPEALEVWLKTRTSKCVYDVSGMVVGVCIYVLIYVMHINIYDLDNKSAIWKDVVWLWGFFSQKSLEMLRGKSLSKTTTTAYSDNWETNSSLL